MRVEAGDCIAQLGFLGGQAEWDRLGELERLILSDREFLTYDQLDAPARERQQAVAEVAGRRSAATAFARARAPG
ncbi:MAG: hypothetical protein H0T15_03990 [Thermoleophilaceae bacterium]|nr:hypothetical protein [Thermoleophilaceae bacterium]